MKTGIPKIIIYPIILLGLTLFIVTGCKFDPRALVTPVPLESAVPRNEISLTQIASSTSTSYGKEENTATTTPESTSSATIEEILLEATSKPSQTASQSMTSTRTPTQIPVLTDTATPAPTRALSNVQEPNNNIVIYLTHVGTGGPIACGDTLVPLKTGQVRTGKIEKDVQIAVDALFAVGEYSLSLYNATYPSKLRFSGFELVKGEAIVDLRGEYIKPNNACDASRYRAQLWKTIEQFPEINRAIPKFKGALLGDLLSIFSDGGK